MKKFRWTTKKRSSPPDETNDPLEPSSSLSSLEASSLVETATVMTVDMTTPVIGPPPAHNSSRNKKKPAEKILKKQKLAVGKKANGKDKENANVDDDGVSSEPPSQLSPPKQQSQQPQPQPQPHQKPLSFFRDFAARRAAAKQDGKSGLKDSEEEAAERAFACPWHAGLSNHGNTWWVLVVAPLRRMSADNIRSSIATSIPSCKWFGMWRKSDGMAGVE